MIILSYKTIDKIIERANAIFLEFAVGVFSKNLNLTHKVIAKFEASITWVNI